MRVLRFLDRIFFAALGDEGAEVEGQKVAANDAADPAMAHAVFAERALVTSLLTCAKAKGLGRDEVIAGLQVFRAVTAETVALVDAALPRLTARQIAEQRLREVSGLPANHVLRKSAEHNAECLGIRVP